MHSWFMEGHVFDKHKAFSTKDREQVDLDKVKRMSWYLYVAYSVTGLY